VGAEVIEYVISEITIESLQYIPAYDFSSQKSAEKKMAGNQLDF
jgi:hypothetical protein